MSDKCPHEECAAYGACGRFGPAGLCAAQSLAYHGVAEETPWGRLEIWAAGDPIETTTRSIIHKSIYTSLLAAHEVNADVVQVEQMVIDTLMSVVAFDARTRRLEFNVKIGAEQNKIVRVG